MNAPVIGIGGFILIASVIALVIWAGVEEINACKAHGGHIYSRTSFGVGISGNGQAVMVPNTTSFCVSADGRILE